VLGFSLDTDQFAQPSAPPDEPSARCRQVEGILALALDLAAAGGARGHLPGQAHAGLPADIVVNPFPLTFTQDEEGKFWVRNKFGERASFGGEKKYFDLAQFVYEETHTGRQVKADEVSKKFWPKATTSKHRDQNLRTATSAANGPLGRVRCEIKRGDRKL
jgi:hypothetical protein